MIELDYRLVLDAFADAVVAADGTNRIVYVNAAAEKLLGWSAEELIGQPLTTLMPARLHDIHTAGYQRFLSTHQPKLIGHPVRVPALRRDGVEIDIELTLSAFQLAGARELFIGALRDLRERVELERQITITRYLRAATAAAARLSSHLDLEYVLRTVVDTLVTDFDAALARVWLYEAETNTLHLRASAGLSRSTTQSSRARIDVATYPYKVGEVARTRRPFVKNGLAGDPQFEQDWVERERIASMAAFPLLLADELRGVFAFFSRHELHDEVVEVLAAFGAIVTASLNDVQLFAREQAARAEAERANQIKTNFLRMVSHELRTPLTTLQLQIQLLQRGRDEGLSPRQQAGLGKMAAASTRLLELIESLLEYARIESGRLTIQPEPLDLATLAAETVEELRSQAEQKKLELRLLPVPDMPLLQSDRRLARLILVNLVGNAIKYTESGTVEVSLAHREGEHQLLVRDTGPGIPPDRQAHVFEPFERLEPVPHHHTPGVGLGLALVKEMVDALGGRIAVDSQVGVGSTFTVVLPAVH